MANSKKALDENGVLYLWGKVKTYVATAIANIKLPSKTSEWMTFSSSTRTRNTCNSASGRYGPTWIAWGWN